MTSAAQDTLPVSSPMATAPEAQPAPVFSVVVPVYNEEGAAADLVREIDAAFQSAGEGHPYEIVFVNDASKDGTLASLEALKPEVPALRVLSHNANAGQSRAVRTGVLAARGGIIVTLDGDGQNPPEFAPRLALTLLKAPDSVGMVAGQRQKRQDSAAKLIASRWANNIRKRLLNDGCDDTGCGLKAFRRDVFLRLPYFDHIHRYLPALVNREGYQVLLEPVGHRARTTGQSKYTNLGRLWVAFSDLAGVMWLNRRARNPGGFREL